LQYRALVKHLSLKKQKAALFILLALMPIVAQDSLSGIVMGQKRVIEISLYPAVMANNGFSVFPRGHGVSLGFSQEKMHWGLLFAGSYYEEEIDNPLYQSRNIVFQNVVSCFTFDWYYMGFLHNRYLLIAPGLDLGIFLKSRGINSTELGDQLTDKNDYYFGGPKIRLNLGYRWLFLTAEPTLLIGTGVAFLMPLGISARF
jgi:hypothetical protein